MFAITEADTDAILAAFDRDGEPAAVVELRRRWGDGPAGFMSQYPGR